MCKRLSVNEIIIIGALFVISTVVAHAQDETLDRIQNVYSESQTIVAKQKAEQEAITKRKTEQEAKENAARTQWNTLKNSTDLYAVKRFLDSCKGTQVEKEAQQRYYTLYSNTALSEWKLLKTSKNLRALQAFIEMYPGTTAATDAKQRYIQVQENNKIKSQLNSLTDELERYKKLNRKNNAGAVRGGIAGLGLAGVGAWMCTWKDKNGDTSSLGLGLGIGLLAGVIWSIVSFTDINKYSKDIRRLEYQISDTRRKLSLSPVVIPSNPYYNPAGFNSNSLAYGLRLKFDF
ncbi:MAG: hypothetical protein LBK97_02960 [Prevotellaceae bacterium]|jgi:hypothetical protein|nr:hypothetical protein [Prevotellaceae bacterium]